MAFSSHSDTTSRLYWALNCNSHLSEQQIVSHLQAILQSAMMVIRREHTKTIVAAQAKRRRQQHHSLQNFKIPAVLHVDMRDHPNLHTQESPALSAFMHGLLRKRNIKIVIIEFDQAKAYFADPRPVEEDEFLFQGHNSMPIMRDTKLVDASKPSYVDGTTSPNRRPSSVPADLSLRKTLSPSRWDNGRFSSSLKERYILNAKWDTSIEKPSRYPSADKEMLSSIEKAASRFGDQSYSLTPADAFTQQLPDYQSTLALVPQKYCSAPDHQTFPNASSTPLRKSWITETLPGNLPTLPVRRLSIAECGDFCA